ncbi:PREDICTED: B3 domain-containing protein At1g05920-like [Ipomoea nil]|uniref:B3 domain-containing protein At1g05920-like n=1 Tax=Ipomoea nil TaxID=35883 RepID=UPI0009018216|nr:PREDICTED: B3 domain-containing protein At1g05920-like [Ipomoea nil]
MVKTVLKLLPDGDYIQLPEDYSGLDLLAEVCTLKPEKLERLVNEQVIGHVQHCPDCHILEPPRASSSEDKGDVCGMAAAMKMSRDYSISLPYSVLNSNKRTRPWDTGDDNATNQKETSAAAKKKKKQKIKKTNHHQGPDPPPAMPIDFRNKILQLAGPNAMISDEKLLIQKTLTMSDLLKNQNRLSIPTKQLRDVKFLTEDEERLLSSRNGTKVGSLDDVMIIEPSLETSRVSLRMWEMRKANGNNSISCVITKTWNAIRERHHLEEGMIVQVWAIRVGEKLWLALVKLPD